ncbi:hypothetical protein COO60DRAFT_907404 [Scenedesmus sp. NREL 46B-D3]|nr:hypothetical protein COO60DRAFT_907404 [Scenedesmus sp. NREL 46B-D3]
MQRAVLSRRLLHHGQPHGCCRRRQTVATGWGGARLVSGRCVGKLQERVSQLLASVCLFVARLHDHCCDSLCGGYDVFNSVHSYAYPTICRTRSRGRAGFNCSAHWLPLPSAPFLPANPQKEPKHTVLWVTVNDVSWAGAPVTRIGLNPAE